MLGSLAAGLGNIAGSLITNAQNRREAERNRSFQERMSSTSHQREVEDLKKAGLNPLLSATGGASTPSGAQATMENIASGAVSSALDARRLKKDIEATDKNIEATDSAIEKNKADAYKSSVEAQVLTRGIPEADMKNKLYKLIEPMVDRASKTNITIRDRPDLKKITPSFKGPKIPSNKY